MEHPMSTRGVVTAVLILFCMGAPVAKATGRVLVPEPDGAWLHLTGTTTIHSRGPLDLASIPETKGDLVLWAPRHYAARARFVHDPEHGMQLRPWSGLSAFVQPPGFAHLRRTEARGWVHFGAWAAAGWASLHAHGSLQDARERSIELQAELRAASTTASERGWLELAAASARDEVFDFENVRDLWAVLLGSVWVGAGLEAWLLTPAPSLRNDDGRGFVIGTARIDRARTALSSLIVPGAGQRAVGRTRAANVFGVAVLLGAAGAIIAQEEFLDARRERLHLNRLVARSGESEANSVLRDELARAIDEEDRASTTRYLIAGAAVVLHACNVLDALRGGGDAESESPATARFHVQPTPDGARAVWVMRFDLR
jgi:hypothetical protein